MKKSIFMLVVLVSILVLGIIGVGLIEAEREEVNALSFCVESQIEIFTMASEGRPTECAFRVYPFYIVKTDEVKEVEGKIGKSFVVNNTVSDVVSNLNISNLRKDFEGEGRRVYIGQLGDSTIQLAVRNNQVVVGIPFIFGSF